MSWAAADSAPPTAIAASPRRRHARAQTECSAADLAAAARQAACPSEEEPPLLTPSNSGRRPRSASVGRRARHARLQDGGTWYQTSSSIRGVGRDASLLGYRPGRCQCHEHTEPGFVGWLPRWLQRWLQRCLPQRGWRLAVPVAETGGYPEGHADRGDSGDDSVFSELYDSTDDAPVTSCGSLVGRSL